MLLVLIESQSCLRCVCLPLTVAILKMFASSVRYPPGLRPLPNGAVFCIRGVWRQKIYLNENFSTDFVTRDEYQYHVVCLTSW